ncbi:hypothetical protein DSL92_01690 [Billgrantia gudaonensis]|uniref:Uncharacterized protein n=1 Tax=Billgrantia gudaonensis TaxID=376427 RepID=A0A432JK86_9GAMM|nr:hypothetical protein DSL92_01690 [Halomonas gudaonensis]
MMSFGVVLQDGVVVDGVPYSRRVGACGVRSCRARDNEDTAMGTTTTLGRGNPATQAKEVLMACWLEVAGPGCDGLCVAGVAVANGHGIELA